MERDGPETKLELGEAENGTVLGVDLGAANIAVTSTGRFFSGGLLNRRRDEHKKVRGSLQQTGTESAHRTLDDMSDREGRWNRDLLHCLSKAIVQEALAHECETIAFEDLPTFASACLMRERFTRGRSSNCSSTYRTRPKRTVSSRSKSTPRTRASVARSAGRRFGRTVPRRTASVARSVGTRFTRTTTQRRTSVCDNSDRGQSPRSEGRPITSP